MQIKFITSNFMQINLSRAFYNKQRVLVYTLKAIRMKYFSEHFFIDLIAATPFKLIVQVYIPLSAKSQICMILGCAVPALHGAEMQVDACRQMELRTQAMHHGCACQRFCKSTACSICIETSEKV
jgi:hypothetical protein